MGITAENVRYTVKEAGEILSLGAATIRSWLEFGFIVPDHGRTERAQRFLSFADLVKTLFLHEAVRSGMSHTAAAGMVRSIYTTPNCASTRDAGIADFEWTYPDGEMFMVMYCNVERLEQIIRGNISWWEKDRSKSKQTTHGKVLRLAVAGR
jgi:hypothetical protein